MNLVVEVLVSVFLVVGAVFLFVGSYALIKLGDTMQRLHGPTKATTLAKRRPVRARAARPCNPRTRSDP